MLFSYGMVGMQSSIVQYSNSHVNVDVSINMNVFSNGLLFVQMNASGNIVKATRYDSWDLNLEPRWDSTGANLLTTACENLLIVPHPATLTRLVTQLTFLQADMASGSEHRKLKTVIRKPFSTKKSDKAVSDGECTDSWSLVNSWLIPHSDVAASRQATSLTPHPSVAVAAAAVDEPSRSTSTPKIVVHESTSQGHEHSHRALP
jgi:hypothetical protein